MMLCRALFKSKSNSKLLFSLSGSRSGVAKQAVGSVGGGQLNGGQLDGLGSGSDGGGGQETAVQAVAVDSGGVHVVDRAGDQGVVAVLGFLQLDQLGVGGCVGFYWLKGSSLVLDGLLCYRGHGVHCAKTVASIDKLGSPSGNGASSGEDDKELHGRLVR